MTDRSEAWLRWLALPAAVAALCLVAFRPVADAGFVNWDDPLTLTRNHDLRGLDGASLRWMWTTSRAGHYQPASWMSLGLDLERFGLEPHDRPDAGGYHVTNLLLHAAGAVALYFLALELLARAFGAAASGAGMRLAVAAAFAALAHAVHPLRCESVCWVTERRDVLSGLFFFLALLAWVRSTPTGGALRSRPLAFGAAAAAGSVLLFFASVSTDDPRALAWRGPGAVGLGAAAALWLASGWFAVRAADGRRVAWGLGSLLLVLASLLAKAWGMVVPALLLVLDAWPLRRLSGVSLASRARAAGVLLLEKAPFVATTLVFARLAYWAQTAQQGRVDYWGEYGPVARALQGLYGIAFYPAKTLVPTGLVPLHPIPTDLFSPAILLAAATSLAVTALLLVFARRAPALLAVWAAYLVTVSPVLGVQQSGPQFVADRYTYLACAPFALLAGGALFAVGRGRGLVWGHAAAAAVLAILVWLTVQQSRVWRSSESLWTHALAEGAPTALAALNLGILRLDQGVATRDPALRAARYDEAADLFARGRALRPGYELFDANEAVLAWRRARELRGPERDAALARATELAERALAGVQAKGLYDGEHLFHAGLIHIEAGRADEAAARFEAAVAREPRWTDARLHLAHALLVRAEGRAMRGDGDSALSLSARARDEIAAADAAAPRAGRAAFLLGSAHDLDAQVLAALGREAEAASARAGARRAYTAVPSHDAFHAEARARVERISAATPEAASR